MKIAVLKERRPYEMRVAATPDTVKKYRALGYDVVVETGAGIESACPDSQYAAAGATIAPTAAVAFQGADIVLKVQRPMTAGEGQDEASLIQPGATLIGMLNPYAARGDLETYANNQVTAMTMELVPRITRAQAMDVLSSQSNLAGYRAVIDAAEQFGRAFPMMMTAAGTIAPARVLVMGAGVAGLQAIATARRMGAIVSATDVRPVAKEQVQSLGATFVMFENEETKQAETSGGYAKEMSEDYKRRQAELIAETIKKQDVVICTALIPGRAAPQLITEDMLQTMKPGSVVVDLAVEQGGNCALSEAGKVVEAYGVRIVGYRNVPSRIAVDASSLYARNVLSFVTLISAKSGGQLSVNWEDEIVKAVTLTHNGAVVHSQFRPSS
jgi:NAD(P) transhydrogenase subunit alpha